MTVVSEREREEIVARYGVIGQPERRDLKALVELAALVCEVPMAAINLMGEVDQHRVATVGIDVQVCRREDSLCGVTMSEAAPVLVSDARLDHRFRNNQFVDGTQGKIRFYASHQLRTPDGVVIGTLCVFDDRPRSITAEQFNALATLAARVVDVLELEVSTRELRVANERLAAFAGQVSHDLKNPLTTIMMSLEMALDGIGSGPDGEAEVQALIERAIRGGGRMGAMIAQLLTFASSGADVQRSPVDLALVVSEVLEDLGEARSHAHFEQGDLPTISADPVQTRVLVQNLLGNAFKFTRDLSDARVAVSARRLLAGLRVEVCDNGPGIPAEMRGTIFEPFARIDLGSPGYGIGLSTCHRIVQAHGGRMGVEDVPDGGSCFWFELPAQT